MLKKLILWPLVILIATMAVMILAQARDCSMRPKVMKNFIAAKSCKGMVNRTNSDGTWQKCVCQCRNTGAGGYYCGRKSSNKTLVKLLIIVVAPNATISNGTRTPTTTTVAPLPVPPTTSPAVVISVDTSPPPPSVLPPIVPVAPSVASIASPLAPQVTCSCPTAALPVPVPTETVKEIL